MGQEFQLRGSSFVNVTASPVSGRVMHSLAAILAGFSTPVIRFYYDCCNMHQIIRCHTADFVGEILFIISPLYNHNGWLGVKHQVAYLLLSSFNPHTPYLRPDDFPQLVLSVGSCETVNMSPVMINRTWLTSQHAQMKHSSLSTFESL